MVDEKVQMIHINGVSNLIHEWFEKDEALNKHFDFSDREKIWNIFWDSDKSEGKITDRHYRFILHLLYDKKRSKLNEVLEGLGIPRKTSPPDTREEKIWKQPF